MCGGGGVWVCVRGIEWGWGWEDERGRCAGIGRKGGRRGVREALVECV